MMSEKNELNKIIKPLTEWYVENHRSLPWRESRNPYFIWISEIMLQQTRVEAVKPFFERFTDVLPSVKDVAFCDEEKLLKLWEGLGYYNRVRNIQKAAQIIVSEYNGEIPEDYDKLLSLPGIGEYTAGAVASIAFNIPVPAVDGNVLRVISRVVENEEDILKQRTKKKIQSMLHGIMPDTDPGTFNQALMELGAMICLPGEAPKCQVCPISAFCLANMHDRVKEIPLRRKPNKRRIEEKTILVIQDGEHIGIRRREKKGLLAGLYEFPNYEGHLKEDQVLKLIESYQIEPLQITKLKTSSHIFSHVEWRMIGYAVRIAAVEKEEPGGLQFVDVQTAEEKYPLPAAFHEYTNYLNLKQGQKKYKGEEK